MEQLMVNFHRKVLRTDFILSEDVHFKHSAALANAFIGTHSKFYFKVN
jgi:hypothetical protein